MRRYLPLLLLSFLVVVAAVAGTFLAGQASRQNPDTMRSFTVYTSLPVEQMAALAQEYEKTSGIRVNVVPMATRDLIPKLKADAANAPRADLVLTGADTLAAAKQARLLAAYSSPQTDIIANRFTDEDDYWTGLWYDPVVFAANRDYLAKLPHQPPARWADLTVLSGVRLVMTDFLVADEAANLLYTMAAAQGEDKTLAYLAALHRTVVQYAKFLATPSRMTGLGEADIAITSRSEAMRYVKDGFPLQVIVPADGTAIYITGAALVAGGPRIVDAGRFIDWLTGNEAQDVLQKNRVFVIPTNPESGLAQSFSGRNLPLLDYKQPLSADRKAKLLDKWVQTVRLAPR